MVVRVSVEGNKQIGPCRPRDVHSLSQWDEKVAVAGELHTITSRRFKGFAQFLGDAEHEIFFLSPRAAAMRPGIDPAVSRVPDHEPLVGIAMPDRRRERSGWCR